jgi:hypothetical protein
MPLSLIIDAAVFAIIFRFQLYFIFIDSFIIFIISFSYFHFIIFISDFDCRFSLMLIVFFFRLSFFFFLSFSFLY